jgi:hypothetical protein
VILPASALVSLAALLLWVGWRLNSRSHYLEARRRWLDAREQDLDAQAVNLCARERVMTARERAVDLTTTALVWRTHLQAQHKEIA